MHTSPSTWTLLSNLVLLFSSSTAAHPTNPATAESNHQSRSCSTAYPDSNGFPIDYSISQSANGQSKSDAYVSFSIPPGSYGCSLTASFPSNYPITSSGNSQVYVYDESNGSQVGTVTFTSPMQATVVTAACSEIMQYRLSIGSLEEAGSVSFVNTNDAGLAMSYNC